MELIKITEVNGNQVVSARELYQFLGLAQQHYKRWYEKNIIKNEFAVENEDYAILPLMGKTPNVGRPTQDFALNINFAKKLSMKAETKKGEDARDYFIECENKVKAKPRTHLEVIQSEMALLIENEKLQLENLKLKPRDEFITKVFECSDLVDIGEVAKILKLDYGRNTLFSVLRDKGILFKAKNEPYQQFMQKGYFEIKETLIRKTEPPKVVTQTYVTQKGLGYIAKILGVVTT